MSQGSEVRGTESGDRVGGSSEVQEDLGTVHNSIDAPITISVPIPAISKVKASELPKFKGNKGSNITLEQWLQKIGPGSALLMTTESPSPP